MSKIHLVLPDPHAHPKHSNIRADWVGKLIIDLNPDTVINLGDQWDMPSLSTFEKGTKAFVGRSYEADLNSGLEFSDRMWTPVRKRKRKMPKRIFLEGNHEFRMKKAMNMTPEFSGMLNPSNLQLHHYYDEVVEYEGDTPGIIELDGILYAHYFVSGVMGRAIGGDHHAASLIAKNHVTCVCGHSHSADWAVRNTPTGKKIHGLVAGVYQDYDSGWAGVVNNKWWKGLVVLRDVEDGVFSPEFISMSMMEKEYGG